MEKDLKSKIDYHDKWLILAGVPLINLINYYLTYPAIRFDTHFFITYSIDTLQGYAAWYSCRGVIFILDRYYSWEKNILKRMLMQVPAVCLTLLAVILGMNQVVTYIARDNPVPAIAYTFDIYIFLIWGFFLNVLYLSLYLYTKLNAPLETSLFENKIWIRIGKQLHPIDLDKGICFYEENETVYLVTPAGKQFIPGYTLTKIEKLTDASRFFRINRYFLIGRDLVKTIRRDENGKLLAVLFPYRGLPESILVGRFKTAAFKRWINSPSTSLS